MNDLNPAVQKHHPAPSFQPGNPLYAPPLDPERAAATMARLEQQEREHRAESRRIDQAWASPEAQKIRDIVLADGNVRWPEFVKHCGGILEVVAMVDDYGLPDTDRIIPKVDELFAKDAQAELDAGSIFRRLPRNRPYVAGRGTAAGEALAAERARPSGERDAREGDAEEILRREAEAAARPRTTASR